MRALLHKRAICDGLHESSIPPRVNTRTKRPFLLLVESSLPIGRKIIRRFYAGTLSRCITQKLTRLPARPFLRRPLHPAASHLWSPSADEDDDAEVQVPAGRRFRRSVVWPAFGQASRRIAPRSAATARATKAFIARVFLAGRRRSSPRAPRCRVGGGCRARRHAVRWLAGGPNVRGALKVAEVNTARRRK
jgi:hypothetical protein